MPTHTLSLLTPREHEIALLVAEGLSNKQIAHRVYLSESAVKNHLTVIYSKLGISHRDSSPRVLLALAVARETASAA